MSEAELVDARTTLAGGDSVPCPDCNGSGYGRIVDWDDPGYDGSRDEPCVRCDGRGQIFLNER
jgi:DnaJ-class molecular chaperone